MSLDLSFVAWLENSDYEPFGPRGAVFHRWLPDGRADELNIPTADARNSLKVWFERRGVVERDFIEYDHTKREVTEERMRRQARLSVGHLWGTASFAHFSVPELEAVRKNLVDSPEYIALGKRVVEFLQPPLTLLIDLLRLQYGQYWLSELAPWDSRTQSLGSYCSSLQLTWREGGTEGWQRFLPTGLSQTAVVTMAPGRGHAECLTEEDWRRIQSSFAQTKDISLALRTIGRAHQLYDSGHISEAFVQGVTALELSIDKFLDTRSSKFSNDAIDSARMLTTLPVKARLSIAAMALPSIAPESLTAALQAVDLRNRIVHSGTTVASEQNRKLFVGLVQCIRNLLGLAELKTPLLYDGNELSAPGSP